MGKNKRSKNKISQSTPKGIKGLGQKKKLMLVIFIVASAICLAINNSLWVSDSTLDARLAEVVNVCINNEKSSECSKIKEQYKANFKYCYSFFDVPRINGSMDVYAIAYNNRTIVKKYEGDFESSFYGCSDFKENIGKSIPDEAISKADNAALYLLNTIPHNLDACINNTPNALWELVPDIESVNSLYENLRIQNGGCNSIRNAFAPTKAKMESYKNSKAVRRFFAEYGFYLRGYSDDIPVAGTACHYTTNGKKTVFYGKCVDNDSFSTFIKEKLDAVDWYGKTEYRKI